MKTALVMGIQASGISASNLLSRLGYEVRLYDDKLEIENNYRDRGEEIYENLDLIVVSPSIPYDHPVVREAESRNIKVISELELGVRELKSTVIAVTGTNGKTTTVDMLEKVLKIMGKKVKTMGNIGYPVSQVVLDGDEPEYAIIECSSFQLERTYTLHPKYALFLNLSPDHMDRYNTYDDYFNAKKRVFNMQNVTDYAVLNYDTKQIRELAKHLPVTIKWVSSKEQKGDVTVKDNYFYLLGQPLISTRESRARGEHNRFNMSAVMTVAKSLGATKEQLCTFVREYRVLPHRVEFVGTVDGISYFNDSKGTNIGACLSAIRTVGGNVGLIMGGSDKKEDYCEFFDEIYGKVKYVAVSGANAEKIFGSAMKVGFTDIKITSTLDDAVNLLANKEGIDTVLFSPASASFDRYSDYQERGEYFKNKVYALKA
ncbi:MAG: UDP-N-acetylmuramoyl-L-alanine--D-glutamate ligase [Clostridia bacterium]|nr:UDP-N-acetylmuramoyl-L-alanine--D-glutamate ligase [Clostridia bacterium]